jgi:FlaA1/EpsC-like NDP-sugar epimerase
MKIVGRLWKMLKLLLEKERTKELRFSVLLFLDVVIIIASLFMAVQLRFGFIFPEKYRPVFWQWVLAFILAKFLFLYAFKMYSISLRFVGIVEFFRLIKAFFLFLVLAETVNLWLFRGYLL